MEKCVKNRQTLEGQLKENESVNQEFKLINDNDDDDTTIYKMIGPVLVKQEKYI